MASNPAEGEPRATGNLNVQNQAQMELETRDALLFRIAATVVDIRPNGTFVIEARRDGARQRRTLGTQRLPALSAAKMCCRITRC